MNDECCHRSEGLYFLNKSTGEFSKLSCKAYICPYCGPRKARKLQNAIFEYIKGWKYVRFATFTIRSGSFPCRALALKLFPEFWRRFITELRRCPSLYESQRKVQFIKVLEFHKSGYPHFHVLFSEFLPRQVIVNIWRSVLRRFTDDPRTPGNVDLRMIYNREKAAGYISKYLMKSVAHLPVNARRWSKSNSVVLFRPKESSNEWSFFNLRELQLYLFSQSISSHKKDASASADLKSAVIDLFSSCECQVLPPPDRPPPELWYNFD